LDRAVSDDAERREDQRPATGTPPQLELIRAVLLAGPVLGTIGLVGSLVSLAASALGELGAVFETIADIGQDVEVDFYRQASQIIPVLLLTLAIESRVFDLAAFGRVREGEWRFMARSVSVLALAAVVVAEGVSLYAVASNRVQPYFLPVTAGILAVLMVLVVVVALGGLRR
jgi:hypothetical protein